MHSSRMRTAHSSSHLLGVCLSACWDTAPPGPGPGHPPGVGLDTPPGQTPQPPPWVWAWTHPLVRSPSPLPGPGPRHLPRWTEFLTHASENITLPQLSKKLVHWGTYTQASSLDSPMRRQFFPT